MSSVWAVANKAHDVEYGYAALAVRAIQCGKDPHWYMERAAAERAIAWEFEATGDIISPLLTERIAELRGRLGARQA